MDRLEAFGLEFDNPSLRIVSAGNEQPLKDVVLYGKGDDEHTGDDEYSSAEFLLTKRMAEAFDQAYKTGGMGYTEQKGNNKIEIICVDRRNEHILVNVTDMYNRECTLTIFDTDIDVLLKVFK